MGVHLHLPFSHVCSLLTSLWNNFHIVLELCDAHCALSITVSAAFPCQVYIHPPTSSLITHLSAIPPGLAQDSFSTFLMGLRAACHSLSQPFSELEVAKLVFNYKSEVISPKTSPDFLLPTGLGTGPFLVFKRPPGYPSYIPIILACPGHPLHGAS